jgi:hypothetical protein
MGNCKLCIEVSFGNAALTADRTLGLQPRSSMKPKGSHPALKLAIRTALKSRYSEIFSFVILRVGYPQIVFVDDVVAAEDKPHFGAEDHIGSLHFRRVDFLGYPRRVDICICQQYT